MATTSFTIGKKYSRQDIRTALGIPGDKGGKVDTGYFRHDDHIVILSNVGVAGRTGHDYGDHWQGADFFWKGKTGSKADQPMIQYMLNQPVLLFTREADRDPFTYHGQYRQKDVKATVPVTIIWTPDQPVFVPDTTLPEEVPTLSGKKYVEGATSQVTVNAYERNPEARRDCIKHWGTACVVCGFDFSATYGSRGAGFIHVHHRVLISTIGQTYEIDPVKDLCPVCPNCHAMLHRTNPPCSIEELKTLLAGE